MKHKHAGLQVEDLDILLPIIDQHAPKVILEIGTNRGGSARLWHERYQPEVLITIDILNHGELDFCHQLVGPSQDPGIAARAAGILAGRKVDLLFIDGSHLENAVRQDFALYAPFVRPDGLIVFHDVIFLDDHNQVPLFWREIKRHYDYIEIAQCYNTTGVGVIFKREPYERNRYGNATNYE